MSPRQAAATALLFTALLMMARFAVAQAVANGAVAVETRTRPNLARFYTKIGEKAELWFTGSEEARDRIARNHELVFIDTFPDVAKMVTDDLRARRIRVGNPGLLVLRYWNMWMDYNAGVEATYGDRVYLYLNWPATHRATRGPQIFRSCVVPLVDISRASLRNEVVRAITIFLPDYEGVYFDMSSWDVYQRFYHMRRIGMWDGELCVTAPFPGPSGFVDDFLSASPDYAVTYHRIMQKLIDAAGDNAKLQLCNFIPRRVRDSDAAYENAYLEIVDGCQMDLAFFDVPGGGSPFTGEDWLFQLETLTRFASRKKYFLAKIPWSLLPEAVRDDALEYGFATYLLGAEGKYALVELAYNFTNVRSDPIVSAPLGSCVGNFHLVDPADPVSYFYARECEGGIVFVNAGPTDQTATLPAGSFTDVRRGATWTGAVPVPAATARILVLSD